MCHPFQQVITWREGVYITVKWYVSGKNARTTLTSSNVVFDSPGHIRSSEFFVPFGSTLTIFNMVSFRRNVSPLSMEGNSVGCQLFSNGSYRDPQTQT